MFDRVLVANRGAIAVRIARTLRRLGVDYVAVHADADEDAPHRRLADHAVALGPGGPADTYLQTGKLLDAARSSGAQAIHPGYGFLSENPDFAKACEAAGITFLGPTPGQLSAFGLKHSARELAKAAGVPQLPGSALLASTAEAARAAASIGYPVMLKSTAGGGGIGMQRCADESALLAAFDSVGRLVRSNFGHAGLFVEKFIDHARHIEVQIFGDGIGEVVALGERDCSAQRRNQKVLEESPAPNLPDAVRKAMHAAAVALGRSVSYRSAGTVEFIYDDAGSAFYFLEVNARLQVEHGVTEAVFGVDIVEWMLCLGVGEPLDLVQWAAQLRPRGHAIQARVYAEDPVLDFRPSAGRLSQVVLPAGDGIRVDAAVETGSEVSAFFDPMLAKVIASGADRAAALATLRDALGATELYGIETNVRYLRALLDDPRVKDGVVTTATLAEFVPPTQRLDVLSPGTLTTVQDSHGRRGYWHVGVPPSGAFDRRSFALGNQLLGNATDAAGLEITVSGPRLRLGCATSVVVCGAPVEWSVDGVSAPMWTVVDVAAGAEIAVGTVGKAGDGQGGGMRAYLLVAGGIDCPRYLGSRATFTLGQFGGHAGRALRTGDVLHLAAPATVAPATLDADVVGSWSTAWTLRVANGPHGAPDFFTTADIETLFTHAWEVHYNSSRTGVRLIGPAPQWARGDGGEAGLHPSNIHDNAYAFGTVDFTGDMPVILGPDGPSLGGFVCPATVIDADLWKVGQLRAGDTVRFEAVSLATADAAAAQFEQMLTDPSRTVQCERSLDHGGPMDGPVAVARGAAANADGAADDETVALTVRHAGDRFVLLEYGDNVLDIELRLRVHALMLAMQRDLPLGVEELTPGIRSLQVHFDPSRIRRDALIERLLHEDASLGDLAGTELPSRIVHLPLSWDDPVCQQAIDHYDKAVREKAPWAPSNIEFIRRINGLASVEAVRDTVFAARYLVMGLGDVYLGAPVATPLDPRHRLVTTKYNPARTWTAENSVGIGGAYLCVYGMEGPGGYQLFGRTVQMWNRDKATADFTQPWLLRFFDQLRFHEVSPAELLETRRAFRHGEWRVKTEETVFSLAEHRRFLADNADGIERFRTQRQAAFDAELANWKESGQLNFVSSVSDAAPLGGAAVPEGCEALDSPVAGTVWKWLVRSGARLSAGETVAIVESMKMEVPLVALADGELVSVVRAEGQQTNAGDTLAFVRPANASAGGV